MTIASEITRLQNDKAAICTAIQNKGVTVGNVKLDCYAACIDAIEQGSGGRKIDILLVGGGGGGSSGGGGGGGVVYRTGYSIDGIECTTCCGADVYTASIGTGGGPDTNGGDTCAFGLTAYGGGAGGQYDSGYGDDRGLGKTGGSGGGAGGTPFCVRCGGNPCYEMGNLGSQGGNGGNFTMHCSRSGCPNGGAGGGGAGGPGGNSDYGSTGGAGGPGVELRITGASKYYGAGGGGGASGAGGTGGGGAAGSNATGIGGGGGSGCCGYGGAIYLRYPKDGSYGINIIGGCKYCSGNYIIHCAGSSNTNLSFRVGQGEIKIPGLYVNHSLCLISMSSDGVNRLTLKDRNQGSSSATMLSCYCSFGKFYQWGNNYGFNCCGTISSKTTTKVDTSACGPSTYCRNCFVYDDTCSCLDWSNPSNNNLWGCVTNTYAARKGPLPSGYHIPSTNEICCMVKIMKSLNGGDLTKAQISCILSAPYTGYRCYADGCIYCKGNCFMRWTSNAAVSSSTGCPTAFAYSSLDVNCRNYVYARGNAFPVRGFKDVACIPTFDGMRAKWL